MYLSAQTKAALERIIGTTLSQVSKMDLPQELAYVKKKTGKDVKFSKKVDFRMSSRDNPLIVRKRICTMEEIDDKIARLK